MNAYVLLMFAILAEIIATTSLKLSVGFTKLYPTIFVVIGYCTAFWLMSLTLTTLPVSVVYAIWSGVGILGIALIGVFFLNEQFGLPHLIGTLLIVAGVIVLTIYTKTH